MLEEIIMPAAGQTTDEALISEILVSIGDYVNKGDVLLEVETDKTIMPIETYLEGYIISLNVKEGDTVHKGDILLTIGDSMDSAEKEDNHIPTENSQVEPKQDTSEQAIETTDQLESALKESDTIVRAMPNVRKIAKAKEISLSDITPMNDSFLTRQDIISLEKKTDSDFNNLNFTVIKPSKMRSAISAKMTQSIHTIPAFQCTVEVNMKASESLRDFFRDEMDFRPSITDVILKAVAMATKDFPLIRSRFEFDEVRNYDHSNIGVAVSVDDGIIVPVVKHVENLGIKELSFLTKELISKARGGSLSSQDFDDASITISNVGMFGVLFATALITPPECCVLAIGTLQQKPFYNGIGFEPIPTIIIQGSFDHRIIDGGYAAGFLAHVKKIIEYPQVLLA